MIISGNIILPKQYCGIEQGRIQGGKGYVLPPDFEGQLPPPPIRILEEGKKKGKEKGKI